MLMKSLTQRLKSTRKVMQGMSLHQKGYKFLNLLYDKNVFFPCLVVKRYVAILVYLNDCTHLVFVEFN